MSPILAHRLSVAGLGRIHPHAERDYRASAPSSQALRVVWSDARPRPRAERRLPPDGAQPPVCTLRSSRTPDPLPGRCGLPPCGRGVQTPGGSGS